MSEYLKILPMKRSHSLFATYLAENRVEIQNSGFDFFQLFKSEILHEQGLENLMHKNTKKKVYISGVSF